MKIMLVLWIATTLSSTYAGLAIDKQGSVSKYINRTSNEQTLIKTLLRTIHQQEHRLQPSTDSQDITARQSENNIRVSIKVKTDGKSDIDSDIRDVNNMTDHLNVENKDVTNTPPKDDDILNKELTIIRNIFQSRRGWGNPNGGIPG
ncbi:hypothetical protein ACF0H5_016052 [Mactra antiquata]